MTDEEYRQAAESLPLVVCKTFWDRVRSNIGGQMMLGDWRDFLSWPLIRETMFTGVTEYTWKEHAYLAALPDWATRWAPAVKEQDYFPCDVYAGANASGNTIHHAYHLARWEQHTGRKISDLRSIYEFGGGYGCTAWLCHRLGFSGEYVIQDLPEFELLQRYFLERAIGEHGVTWRENPKGPTELFIAEWSLSEVPAAEREEYIGLDAEHYLFAFSQSFGGQQNEDYFEKFASLPQNANKNWLREHIQHLPPRHSYLMA